MGVKGLYDMVQKRRGRIERNRKTTKITVFLFLLNVLIWGSGIYLWSREVDVPPSANPILATANDIRIEEIRQPIVFNHDDVLTILDVGVNFLSEHVLLVNLNTGEVIFDHRASERAYPASVTKIMTVLVGLEHARDDEVTVNFDADALFSASSSMTGFVNGEVRSLSEILHGAMLTSGGDSTTALAYHVADSYDAFVGLMNSTARRLGMTDTHFMNASGLHHDDHYTTARDTAILLEYALNNRHFREIFTAAVYPFVNSEGSEQLMHSTMFQSMPISIFDGGEILGGKVGFTTEAGLSLASFATDGSHDFALITFGAPAYGVPSAHIQDAFAIYEYFFNSEN